MPVPDLDAGLAFFRERLGHPPKWRHEEAGQAGLALARRDTELVLTTRGSYQPTWLVPSAQAVAVAVVAVGNRVVNASRDIPVGRVVVADEFGHNLVLIM